MTYDIISITTIWMKRKAQRFKFVYDTHGNQIILIFKVS